MATASNQDQLNEVTDELIRRVQDALLAALGTINIGEEQRIGLLAAIDDLSSAPVGNLQTLLNRLTLQNVAGRSVVGGAGSLMAQGFGGLGAMQLESYPLSSLELDPSELVSKLYRCTNSTGGAPRINWLRNGR